MFVTKKNARPTIMGLQKLNCPAIKIAATFAKTACAVWVPVGAGRLCNCCREFIRPFSGLGFSPAIKIAATFAKTACAVWVPVGAGRLCYCCREFIRPFSGVGFSPAIKIAATFAKTACAVWGSVGQFCKIVLRKRVNHAKKDWFNLQD